MFPLIVSAYASRILFAEGIGKISSAQNIATYFTLLAALGLPTYGTKVIAAIGEDKKERDKAFSELFIINAVSTIICSLSYLIIIITIPYFHQRMMLSIVCGLSIIFNIINIDWYYQGREKYGYIVARSFFVKLISLISVFIFVKSIDDYIIYAIILTLSKAANNIFNIVHVRKEVTFKLKKINIVQHLKPVFIFLAASIAIEIYTLADTTMLTFIHGDRVVGYYTTARKAIDVIRTMIIAVCAVFLPRLSYYYSSNQKEYFNNLVNKGIKILAYITIPATIGVILMAEYFVPLLFGKDFINAVLTTQILSFSIITVAFSNFFGYQVLVTIGKEKQMLISTIIGAIVNIILNFILIFYYKQNGVAIASTITELCVSIYQFFAIKKEIKIDIKQKFISSIILGSFVMLLIVIGCKYLIKNSIVLLIVSIVLGSIIYFIITYICKNEISNWLLNYFCKLKNKLRKFKQIITK